MVRNIYSLCAVVCSQSDFGQINTMFVQVFETFSAFHNFLVHHFVKFFEFFTS